jgi:hypothetical protein
MKTSVIYLMVRMSCPCAALGCMHAPESPPSKATAAPATSPASDAPESCFDEPQDALDLAERKQVAFEIERQIVARSEELRSCLPAHPGIEEVDLQVDLSADGTTRAKVTGTSISDCAAISCIRDRISGLQLPPPQTDMNVGFRWLLEIEDRGPVRAKGANAVAKWLGTSPENSAACLDALPEGIGHLPIEAILETVRGKWASFTRTSSRTAPSFAVFEKLSRSSGFPTPRMAVCRSNTR